jgi:hypothetical protein
LIKYIININAVQCHRARQYRFFCGRRARRFDRMIRNATRSRGAVALLAVLARPARPGDHDILHAKAAVDACPANSDAQRCQHERHQELEHCSPQDRVSRIGYGGSIRDDARKRKSPLTGGLYRGWCGRTSPTDITLSDSNKTQQFHPLSMQIQ